VGIGCRWRYVACFGAGLCVVGAVHGQAQDSGDEWARAQPAANRAEAVASDAEKLLGGPAPAGDFYGTAGNSARARARGLSNTQRVPRGGLTGGRDALNDREREEPMQRVQRPGEAQPGIAGAPAARDANVNRADPGTQSPTQSALSIYHGPGDVGKAVGQVYRMPW
jgi:hypothetical protein